MTALFLKPKIWMKSRVAGMMIRLPEKAPNCGDMIPRSMKTWGCPGTGRSSITRAVREDIQVVGSEQVAGLSLREEEPDHVIEQPLAKLQQQVADGEVLPKKKSPLSPKTMIRPRPTRKYCLSSGFPPDDAVDDVFGIIDRGGGEDVETDHADQAERIRPL